MSFKCFISVFCYASVPTVDNMDPNHILVLDNGCEKVWYKRLYNVWPDYLEIPKLELTSWVQNGVNIFYIHNTSKDNTVHENFAMNIMADIINVIENQYDSDLEEKEITYHKSLSDVGEHMPTLLMTAVGVAKSKYVNMLMDQFEKDNFILSEFPVANIHLEDQIKDVHKSIKNNIPHSCSHVIFTFIYRYKDETMESYKTVIFHFIESLIYNYRQQVNPDTGDLLLYDITNIFKDLEIRDESMACVLYMDKTTVLEESEQLFHFFQSFMKVPEDVKINMKKVTLRPLHTDNDSVLIDKLVEVMAENAKLKASLRQLQGKYKEISVKIMRKKEVFKNTIKKEVIEKLTASHNERIQSQRVKFDEINNRLKINYQEKLESMEKFYEKYVRNCREQYEKLYEVKNLLRFEKSHLEKETVTLNTRLKTMQDLATGETPRTPSEVPGPLTEEDDVKFRIADISNMIQDTETNQLYKTQIQDLQLKSDKLSEQIIQKQNDIDNLILQLKFYKSSQEESDKTKQQLEAENAELIRTVEDIQTRHTEQFRIYERLLEKSRKETDVHKREVTRLREHLSSDNSPLRLQQKPRIAPVNRRPNVGRCCCKEPKPESTASKIPPPPPLPSDVDDTSTPSSKSTQIESRKVNEVQMREVARLRELLRSEFPPPPRVVPSGRVAPGNRRHVMRQCSTETEPESAALKLPTPPPPPSEVGSTNGLSLLDTSTPTYDEGNSDIPVFSKWLRSAEKATHELVLPKPNEVLNPLHFSVTTPNSKTKPSNSDEPACIKWLRSMEKAKSEIDSRLLKIRAERANSANSNESTQTAEADNPTPAETETTVAKPEQPRKHQKRGRPKKKNFRKK